MKFHLQRWLREPLVHFLVLGALLFLLFHFAKGSTANKKEEIVITTGTIRTISENFQRVWKRPPSKQELDSLIQEYIKEEIYYREAMALGLDRDDTIIRRRLRQKMEFLAEGMGSIREPTDKDLDTYLKKQPEKFRVETRYTFNQVYLNPDRRKQSIQKDAQELLQELNSSKDSDSSKYGDPFMLGYFFSNQPERNVARTFGDEFAKQLSKLETRKWVGPVESGYGLHLVLITDRTEGRLPDLFEVRQEVQREWMVDQQKQTSDKFFEALRNRYSVTIEEPQKSSTTQAQP
jgi:parvulin-like peptidyl-prolyl isomerase